MRLKHENKGFSLVELIITISVFAIVGVVLGAFMLSSSRAYSVMPMNWIYRKRHNLWQTSFRK